MAVVQYIKEECSHLCHTGVYILAVLQIIVFFNILCYRDPNCQCTLDTFRRSAEWAARGEFTEQDVSEALLSVFSKVRHRCNGYFNCINSKFCACPFT